MTIDIISYTDAQFAELSEEQLLEVQSAQLKKERLDLQLEENVQKEKYRLLKNGVFRSDVFALYKAKLQAEHDMEVENIRDSLLFYLRFASRTDSNGKYSVDYSLSMLERYNVVRDYYMTNYADGNERFAAFKSDTTAMTYLGEGYGTLYDYLLTYTY